MASFVGRVSFFAHGRCLGSGTLLEAAWRKMGDLFEDVSV